MDLLQDLYDITVEMLHVLQAIDETERDKTIEKIDQLILQRDQMIKKLQAPYTDEEIETGQKVIQLNEQIKQKMGLLYENIKDDMKQVKQKKELNRSYINPYGSIQTTDGMYVDRKQ